jgi:hypothetical protein
VGVGRVDSVELGWIAGLSKWRRVYKIVIENWICTTRVELSLDEQDAFVLRQIYTDIAREASNEPTTAKQINGEIAYEIVKNFAIDIFSFSSAPLTSAKVTSFVAGGPVGIIIITNQRIGSLSSKLVLSATR